MAQDEDIRRRRELRERLPARDTVRWVASRKAAVVQAVEGGALTEGEALSRYHLTAEELESWRVAMGRHGRIGLRATWTPSRGV